MFDQHEITELLTVTGIDIPPVGAPGPNAQTLAHKIAWDGFVQKIAMELACQAFTVAAVKGMTQSQRAVLRKRIGVDAAAPAPSPTREITWHVALPVMPSSPVALVGRLWHAELNAEGKKQIYEETRYHGTPEGAHRVTWKGSRPSAEVVEEYQRAYKPLSQFDKEYYQAARTHLKPDPPKVAVPDPTMIVGQYPTYDPNEVKWTGE